MKSQISPKTKAIIVLHMFGNPAEVDPQLVFGIPIIEDCAQSLGVEYKSHRVGSIGKLSAFSFYATKMIANASLDS